MTEPASQMTPVDHACIDERLLPPQMRDLIKLIGLSETLRLIQHRGGGRVRIPITEYPNELDRVLCRATVIKLIDSKLAGQRLTLPKMDKVIAQLRDMDIRANRYRLTKNELARRYNLHERRIQQIWNGDDEPDPTLDMFDSGRAARP